MSNTYPTAEQLDAQYTAQCAQLGALDYEYRQLLERYTSIGERLQELEGEKRKRTDIIDRLAATKAEVMRGAESEESGTDEDQDTAG